MKRERSNVERRIKFYLVLLVKLVLLVLLVQLIQLVLLVNQIREYQLVLLVLSIEPCCLDLLEESLVLSESFFR